MDRFLNVVTILSIGLFLLVLFSVRRERIRPEYSVTWLLAAAVLVVLSRCRALLAWLAAYTGLAYVPLALVLLVFCVFLVVFYRFSIVISRLKDANIAMAQRLAILEYRIRHGNESK